MLTLFTHINSFVWGPPLLGLLVGTGIYLSFRLGFIQLRQLSGSLSNRTDESDI
ncbi:hypothetical protein SUB73_08860 [Streptococcus agalactiae]